MDPGVGGVRKPILLVTKNYFFVGPDNGLFTLVAQREKEKQVVVLTKKKYFLPKVSRTFHGRDIFAPGTDPLQLLGEDIGDLLDGAVCGLAQEVDVVADSLEHLVVVS